MTHLAFSPWFVVQALWLLLPAYVANMAPVILAKLLPRWSAPIDGGRTRADGTRLLGDGKTWRGLFGGALVAGLVAWAQAGFAGALDWSLVTRFGAGTYPMWWVPLVLGFALGLGALVGDAVKSYFKRRSGRPRGQPWVGPDQLDFVVGSLLFVIVVDLALVGSLAGFGPSASWTSAWLVHRWWLPLTIVVLTPLLHWLVNVLGYKLGLKEVPW